MFRNSNFNEESLQKGHQIDSDFAFFWFYYLLSYISRLSFIYTFIFLIVSFDAYVFFIVFSVFFKFFIILQCINIFYTAHELY